MAGEDCVADLTAIVVHTCRRLRLMQFVTWLLPDGIEVGGLTDDEQRALVRELASPAIATVRDGARVKVTLK